MDLTWITLPWQFSFMQNAFFIGMIVAVPTAILSCFLVVKSWALMGDAVSHAVLPGIVLAYLVGLPLLVGAFVAGMVCSVATGYVGANSRVKPDTVMGVVFSGMFALGLVLFVAVDTGVDLGHVLYGNMLGIETGDLSTALVVACVVSLGLLVFWRDILAQSFDAAHAQAVGLRTTWLHYGLLAALSLTIVTTLSAVGLILSIGLVIMPGAIAYLFVRRFAAMMIVAVGVCALSMVAGVYVSFYINSAPAPTIILILTFVFLLGFVRRQILTRRASRQTVEPNAKLT